MDMDEPRNPLAKVAEINGYPLERLLTQMRRGQPGLLETDQPAKRRGIPRLVSLRSALQIGAFISLVRNYVPPSVAAEAAAYWVNIGDDERDPAGLYAEPWTLLCVYPEALFEIKHSPISTGKASDLFVPLMQHRQSGGVFINLDDVDRRTRISLGY